MFNDNTISMGAETLGSSSPEQGRSFDVRSAIAGLGLSVALGIAPAAAAPVDRDLMTAIEDALSDDPQIRGICAGLAQAAAITGEGSINVAYPINDGVSEAQLQAAVQRCLDWDYAKSAEPGERNALIIPMDVTAVEMTGNGIRVTVRPRPTDADAALQEASTTVLQEVFGVTAAHAALPDSSELLVGNDDPLVMTLGVEGAAEIRAMLAECLLESQEFAAELEADGEPADVIAEELEIGAEDCAADNEREVRLALLEQRNRDLDARIAAANAQQASIRAKTEEIRVRTAERRANIARLQAESAELKVINDELTGLLIERAICEAQDGDACGVHDERIAELFAAAQNLQEPDAPITVGAGPDADRTRVARAAE